MINRAALQDHSKRPEHPCATGDFASDGTTRTALFTTGAGVGVGLAGTTGWLGSGVALGDWINDPPGRLHALRSRMNKKLAANRLKQKFCL